MQAVIVCISMMEEYDSSKLTDSSASWFDIGRNFSLAIQTGCLM